MKSSIRNIFLFLIPVLSSCLGKEQFAPQSNLGKDTFTVYSSPMGMDDHLTRTAKDDAENLTTTKTMLIFDAADQLVKVDFKFGQDATFVIDRNLDKDFINHADKAALEHCSIYVVANLGEGELNRDNIKSLKDLYDHRVNAAALLLPDDIHLSGFKGFPMIGSAENINLNPNAPIGESTTHIFMKAIYSKIMFYLSVRPDQMVPGEITKFNLDRWTVRNIPSYTFLGETGASEETPFVKDETSVCLTHAGETKVSGTNPASGDNSLEFGFYILEHRVNPQNNVVYPEKIREDEKQRFKPQWVSELQRPLNVLLEGRYFDHQGHSHEVKYTLYPGENNKDDFHILRNRIYYNIVTIKGLTNHKYPDLDNAENANDNVSIDHRVEVTPEDVEISVERETMLDCHYEIRPLDIDFDPSFVNSVDIQIVDPVNTQKVIKSTTSGFEWVRFEKKGSAPAGDYAYCTNGKRRYFTTDLVTQTLKNNVSTTITKSDLSSGNNRIWIYFDENRYASVDKMRDVVFRFRYNYNDGSHKFKYFKFRQHDLYPVKTKGGKTYYIEYYEEYLYNFDPKDKFSVRTDGMKWGLENVLYSENDAIKGIYGGSGFLQQIVEEIMSSILQPIRDAGGKYDYEDPYKGQEYTMKLIRKGNGTEPFNVLPLDQLPRSAAEYCYNKNKRKADGRVPVQAWYLPAIGEIQDITASAYAQFKVFQNELYWSSQTSYLNGEWSYTSSLAGNRNGTFYIEDLNYARATRTVADGQGNFSSEPSEVRGIYHKIFAERNRIFGGVTITEQFPYLADRDPGNQRRSDIHRVRAVRMDNGDITMR